MPTDALPNLTLSEESPHKSQSREWGMTSLKHSTLNMNNLYTDEPHTSVSLSHRISAAHLSKMTLVSPLVQIPPGSDHPPSLGESPDSSDTDQDPMQVEPDHPTVPAPNRNSDALTSSLTVDLPIPTLESDERPASLTTTYERSREDGGGHRPDSHPSDADGDILTTDEDLGARITFDSPEPFNSRGQFSDIYLGTHQTLGKLALKRLRRLGSSELDEAALEKLFLKETEFWIGFRHHRILTCFGSFKLNGHRYFVSPFMRNGNLFDWIKPETPGLERLRLIFEISDALAYIHLKGMVHGDVKAHNVLLSDDLHVQLCDFGLTKAVESCTSTRMKGTGSFRWQSPELWNNESKTPKSDVYAFAMTVVEARHVLTGQIPFSDLKYDPAVMMAVTGKNLRPAREPATSPDGTSYAIAWDVADRGWRYDANERMSMEDAVKLLSA